MLRDAFGGTVETGRMVVWYFLPPVGNGFRLFPQSGHRRSIGNYDWQEDDVFESELGRFKTKLTDVSGPHPNGAYMVTLAGCRSQAEAETIVLSAAERAWRRAAKLGRDG